MPNSSVIVPGQRLQFSAQVTGVSSGDVVWGILNPASTKGAIDVNGLYTAPGTAPDTSITIVAQIAGHPNKTAMATVWFQGPGTVSTTSNPLVARYSIVVPDGGKVKIEFGPDTSYGLNTWSQAAPPGGGPVTILVAGMRSSSLYHMRADIEMPDGTQLQDVDHAFQTGPLPAGRIPQIAVQTSGILVPNSGVELLTLSNVQTKANPLEALVTDLQGNVIWYYDLNPTGTDSHFPYPIKLMSNGHMLVNVSNPGLLREIDLAGNIIREMTVPELNTRLAAAGYNLSLTEFHHDFAMLPNGHIILLTFHYKNFTDLPGYPGATAVVGDTLVDLDQNWNPVWVWDAFDHLDVNRHPRGLPDWTHGNAVFYSADDGNLLYSSRHQSWIIKIDYEDGKGNGDVLWKFGYQGDFTLDSGAPAAWQYGQHNIQILSANTAGIFTLGAFDNGYIRVLDDSGSLCGTTGEPDCYSRVPFFQVDEATRTAHVIWEDSNLPFSSALGSIELLANGDVEFDEGFLFANPFNSHVKEVTQEVNPQTVWELDVTGQAGYRIFRIPSLYPGVQW
ncbi:MAG TPA: aryl-sulfate sulfotransferase [Terriglobia bacterium]|nr:aryl-sulfate sulfotransferase [Terriglobia bacterium]